MASYVPWVVAVCLVVLVERAGGQAVQYTDQQAGSLLNTLGPHGVRLAIKWHDRFWPQFAAVKNTLELANNLLVSEFDSSVRINLTAMVESELSELVEKVNNATAIVESLNYNNTDDGLILYMKSPTTLINAGGHYSDGMFTVPQDGLYKVLLRNLPVYSFSCEVIKNGNETIIGLTNSGYYDVRTRVKLIKLNQGDEVYTTGSTPDYFLIMRLRVQHLMQNYLNN
ncbi:hypothetical protein ACOMHN_043557 [Nucella lapillus]